jgi:hypothetical protein
MGLEVYLDVQINLHAYFNTRIYFPMEKFDVDAFSGVALGYAG